MSITDHINKIKSNSDFALFLVVILSVVLGVGFGRLWGVYDSRNPLTIIEPESPLLELNNQATVIQSSQDLKPAVGEKEVIAEGKYVASKNSDKYHLSTCPGAKQIKEENKRWFASKADAENAGLVPAANCPGI